jgi:hypothetical protein
MFEESNLHSLIARESRLRRIPRSKLLRESLQAAADEKFTVFANSGLSPDWREKLWFGKERARRAELTLWHYARATPFSEVASWGLSTSAPVEQALLSIGSATSARPQLNVQKAKRLISQLTPCSAARTIDGSKTYQNHAQNPFGLEALRA